jgi:hypothetical protein
MTVSLEIRDAAMTALNADLPSGIPTATKRRVMPGEPVREPFIAVFLGIEPATNRGRDDPLTKRKLEVLIELGIVTEDLSEVDDLIEPLRAHVVARLGDTNLDGKSHQVTERGITERTTYKLDLYAALVIVTFDVEYHTARADLGAMQ